MKLFIIFTISITILFSGGNFSTSKYKKLYQKGTQQKEIVSKHKKMAIGYIKPKCQDCGEPAELLPYHGEDLPEAKTYPCPSSDKNECEYHMG